jgi:hypothetical protein
MAEMECFANETGEQRSGHRQNRNEVPDHDKTNSFRLFNCSFAVSIMFPILGSSSPWKAVIEVCPDRRRFKHQVFSDPPAEAPGRPLKKRTADTDDVVSTLHAFRCRDSEQTLI